MRDRTAEGTTDRRGVDPVGAPPPHRGHRNGLLAVLLAGQFMANMDGAISNVAAPAIRADLAASDAQLALVIAGYVLAYGTLLITGARLGQARGHRAVYLLGLLIFTVASLACGLAGHPLVLIGARMAQGVGAALLVPQVLTGIMISFDGAARVRALGAYAVVLAAGSVTGQVFGGLLVSADLFGLSWRPAFLLNVPIGVVLLVTGIRLLPPPRPGPRHRLDVTGMVLLGSSMVLLILPLVSGREQGWPAWTWLCLAASVPAFAFFLAGQRAGAARGRQPLLNLEVLGVPALAWGLLAIAVGQTTYAAMLFTLPLHLQEGLGHDARYAGLVFAPWAAAFGVGGVHWHRLPSTVRHLAAPLGYGLLAGAYLILGVLTSAGLADGPVLPAVLAVAGLGLGVGFCALIASFGDTVPGRFAPDVSGLVSTVLQLFAVVGVTGFGSVYLGLTTTAGPAPSVRAHALLCLLFTVTALVATVAARRATAVVPVPPT
ncbi:MFS transporter [Micromonospora rifamycinica]|uniref:MFS transporter n=1 Tax=Micromonospora rifamycinica TaxID=291594 RepID=UPI0033F814DE